MRKLPDYYRLLHIQPDAPAAVIKASYRAMMQKMQLHPDLGGDEVVAQRLNEAVATLCDPAKRTLYDSKLALQARILSANTSDDTQRTTQPDDIGGAVDPESTTASKCRQKSDRSDDTPTSDPASEGSHQQNESVFTESSISCFPVKSRCPFCLANYPAPSKNAPIAYSGEYCCTRCHGAATPISAIESIDQDELRKIHRLYHESTARLWKHWPIDEPKIVTISDLSPAGCAIDSTIELARDSVVLIDSELLNAICKVRYCRQHSAGSVFLTGLQFLTLQIRSTPGAIFSSSA